MKKKFGIFSIIVIAVVGAIVIYNMFDDETEVVKNFSDEYTLVSKDNIYKYTNVDDIINILEKGRGVIFLGYPSKEWASHYAKYLNEALIDRGAEKIYYYNFLRDREINSVKYQKLIELLDENLYYDEHGEKIIYSPTIIYVLDGEVKYYKTIDFKYSASEFFSNEENINNLKLELSENFDKIFKVNY